MYTFKILVCTLMYASKIIGNEQCTEKTYTILISQLYHETEIMVYQTISSLLNQSE